MPPYRQDLTGVKDDGTLVGRGGRKQTLGASAQRRLAKSTASTSANALTKPAVQPQKPETRSLTRSPDGGEATDIAVSRPMRGFSVNQAIQKEPPPEANAIGAGLPNDIADRMAQLAAERGGGGAPTASVSPMGGNVPPELLAAIAQRAEAGPAPATPITATAGPALVDASGAPAGPVPKPMPGFGVAGALPGALAGVGGPGPGGLAKPMLGARPPSSGVYDGLAATAARLGAGAGGARPMGVRNAMAGFSA